jgi:glycosyltransferase involved in cell wall biosynthesis
VAGNKIVYASFFETGADGQVMKVILSKGQFMGPISGADETLVAYATHLQLNGHSVSVLLMYPHSPDDQYYVRLRSAGVPVSCIATRRMQTSISAGRKLATRLLQVFPPSRNVVRNRAQKIATSVASRFYDQCCDYLKKSNADLIHVVTPDPSAMVLIRAAYDSGVPVFYQELGTPYHPPEFESYYEEFTSVLPLCSEVAALSPQLAEQCREKLPFISSLSVLPLMTNDLHDSTGEPKSRSRGVTFGFAARLEHLKGPLVLINAFADTCRKFENVKLRVAGAGSLKQKVLARAELLGIAGQCDFQEVYKRPEQKSVFMESLDVFVLPSLTEGTPNSVIEAMAHGLPVIATAVGGLPDVVTSETGILVPPDDPEALGRAMMRLVAEPELRAQMGRAAKGRYQTHFSPGVVLPVMLETYRRVAWAGNGAHSAAAPNGKDLMHPWASESS